jgi:hypothetical protein
LRWHRDTVRWRWGGAFTASSWGLDVSLAPSAVWEILHVQAEAIPAPDFFHVDLLDDTSAYFLAVIEHATRRIRILGMTAHPNYAWATQQARTLADGRTSTGSSTP